MWFVNCSCIILLLLYTPMQATKRQWSSVMSAINLWWALHFDVHLVNVLLLLVPMFSTTCATFTIMKENIQKTTHFDATFQQGISEVAVKHRGTRITNIYPWCMHYITLSWLFTYTERFLPQGVIPCVTKQSVYILMLLWNHMVHLAAALLVSFLILHQSLGTRLVSR